MKQIEYQNHHAKIAQNISLLWIKFATKSEVIKITFTLTKSDKKKLFHQNYPFFVLS